ncbi:hypothetical protein P4310_27985 [Bacillus thuringiensis]|uniref:hypothetical protein n=1 Tax=Bacillus thuringiensis TaxID=1428 RepID=UPI000A3B0DE2|nr:hypothetical protein [Bacillus thuringiensis]MED3069282.1 hypothetical protein [Bacillus thuringiensis]OUB32016.1 hypothetical protein BK737_14285 [Bacillus thuringiensis serovar palmanyolensis]
MLRFLKEVTFSNESRVDFTSEEPIQKGFIKVFLQGTLAAEGRDGRLLMRINDLEDSYVSFVHMGGAAGMGEWGDASGLYLGRTGWGLDATFSAEVTLAVNTESQQVITGSGASVFALGDNRILGYENHGHLVTQDPIKTISFLTTEGNMSGFGSYYVYQPS